MRILISSLLLTATFFAVGPALAGAEPDADATSFVQFVEDDSGNCVARQAREVLVKNTHGTRKIRVWLDRYLMGIGTGDRSRTDLVPGAEPDPLGCSRSSGGVQEWRLVRAVFLD